MVTSPAPALDFRTIDLRGKDLSLAELRAAVPRLEAEHGSAVEDAVRGIIADVRSGGFAALSLLAEKFDGVAQRHPRVPSEAIAGALESLDPGVRAALEESIRRARLFAEAQCPEDVTVRPGDGATVTQR
ncbi:MAG: histidinol dehydrogenase, partial [Sinomonas sp.]|nr:histidinol dehydrogenase [Sinomonas sp.]